MSEIITIPAGVIMPKELLVWLRRQRDRARGIAAEYDEQGDEYEAAEMSGFANGFDAVIQHVQFGADQLSALDLSALTADELGELVRTAEHAERKAHVALAVAPLGTRRVEDSAVVFQDARAMLNDAQDETILRLAAAMDEAFGA